MKYLWRLILLAYGVLFASSVIPTNAASIAGLAFITANASAEAGRDYALAAASGRWPR